MTIQRRKTWFWWIAALGIVAIFLLGIGMTGTATAAAPVIIDFETAPGPDGQLGTPDDVPLSEGTLISTQFAPLGVQFFLVGVTESPFIATAGLPAVGFMSGLSLEEDNADQPTASGDNTLTDGAPGNLSAIPGASAVDAEYGAEFSVPVSMVSLSLIDFGDRTGCLPPVTSTLIATLEAFNAGGNPVGSDSFTIDVFQPGSLQDGNIAQLQVTAPGIVRVQTTGTRFDCGTAIDDFTFKPEAPVPPTPIGGSGIFPGVPGDADTGGAAVLTWLAALAAGALTLGGAAWYARRRSG